MLTRAPLEMLVIRLSSLGDIVLTSPTVSALKKANPHTRVTFLTKSAFAPVWEGHPYIDEVWVWEQRGFWGWLAEAHRRGFDGVVDLHATGRSRAWSALCGAGRCLRYDKRALDRRRLVWFKTPSPRLNTGVAQRYMECLAPLGISIQDEPPRLYLKPDEALRPEWAARLGSKKIVAVAPGAAHATKRWGPDRFAQTAARLARRLNASIVLLGSASDRLAADAVALCASAPVINAVGETTLREMMILLHKSSLLLTNDSGAMHVGVALGVPTVAVFGPTVRSFGFFPAGPQTRVVETEGLSCRPCALHGSPSCPLGHFRCMNDISVDRVVAAAEELL